MKLKLAPVSPLDNLSRMVTFLTLSKARFWSVAHWLHDQN